jgi:PPP family 3-phenylpropionic acid transporter
LSLPAGVRAWPLVADSTRTGVFALKLYLFLLFASVGLTEPFLNLHLRRLGFTGSEIGFLAAIQPGIAAVAPFLWTAWADSTGRTHALFQWNSWLCGVSFIPVLILRAPGPLAVALAFFALLTTPLVPLANGLAFQALGTDRRGYGHIRLWGSVGYILAAVSGGIAADRVGILPVLGAVVGLLGGCGAVASAALRRNPPAPPAPLRAGLADLLREPRFRFFLAATFLARLSAAPFNTFFTIQLDALKISLDVAGWAWSLGVISEVAVMAAWPRLVGPARPERLLAVAIGAHAARWWLNAEVISAAGLLAIQLLHGLTFGLFYVASVHLMDEMIRPELRATGQGIFAAGVFGVGGLVGNLGAGRLFDAVGLPALYRLAGVLAMGATLGGVLLERASGGRKVKA